MSKIGKFLFYFDDVNVARIYEGIGCRKLIIWDKLDEIVVDSASIKNGLLNHIKKVKSKV